jgi:redox-sensitive bicupin YhaK (pirin superfamily)
MITLRRSDERGRSGQDVGWLDSRHTFSFSDYYDPQHMHFRALRVVNEDWVAAKSGFPPHGHRDMEIVTYVLEGELSHQDSMGNGSTIRPGDVQRMSAGTGVIHSEMNRSPTQKVHLYQIWILPSEKNLTPSYEQKNFAAKELAGRLRHVASSDGRDGSVTIHTDVAILATKLAPKQSVAHELAKGRSAWLQVARGELLVNGTKLSAGDGAAITDERKVELVGVKDAEALLFDLA